MEEPSVLDFLKSKLMPWRREQLELPQVPPEISASEAAEVSLQSPIAETRERPAQRSGISASAQVKTLVSAVPWRSLLALFLALAAQYSLGPAYVREWKSGVVLLVLAMACLVWANLTQEWVLPEIPEGSTEILNSRISLSRILLGLFLAVLAFISFGTLRFNIFNLTLLVTALGFIVLGAWSPTGAGNNWLEKIRRWLARPQWSIAIRWSSLLAVAVVGWVAFFRLYNLAQAPPEMNSDHAEKFLDVLRILNGQTNIFFPTNGGREGLQFYLAAGLHRLLGMPLNFFILKFVSSLIGMAALPFLYLLGKEIGNRRVGLFAFFFAGIAYWPNVVSRFGLRLPFYMFFTAALFYYLVRGLKHNRRNDFILAGAFLGLSFYGYSADRILPLLVLTAVGLYLLHSHSAGHRKDTVTALAILVLVSFVLFLPLLRYMIEEPGSFFLRTFTRMGSWEREITDPVAMVFLNNLGRALTMFSWDNGHIWPISIPGNPALSIVPGALFYSGLGLVLIRSIRKRHWLDLLLLLSIPLLMLPSILSIAFPSENPNLYRTGGVIVPVFLLIGMALDSLMTAISRDLPSARGDRAAWLLVFFLMIFNSLQDYDLVFHRYTQQYRNASWNSSEMGQVVRGYLDLYNRPDTVWVIGFPNWVDTRLVANNAGFPGRDYELKVENIPTTQNIQGPKLFLLNPEDQAAKEALQQLYPEGKLTSRESQVESKDFLIFLVPPEQDN